MADSKRYGFYIYPSIKIYVLKIRRISIAGEIKLKYGWAYEDIRAHDLFNQKVIDLFSYSFSGINYANSIETSIEYRFKTNKAFSLTVGYQRSYFKEADSYDGNYDKYYKRPYLSDDDLGTGRYFGLKYSIGMCKIRNFHKR